MKYLVRLLVFTDALLGSLGMPAWISTALGEFVDLITWCFVGCFSSWNWVEMEMR